MTDSTPGTSADGASTTSHSHTHGQRGAPSTQEQPIRVGILTCSDRGARGERADVSGPTIHNLVVDRLGGKVAQYRVVPDERQEIEAALTEWVDREKLDLVLTTGGTGFSPRDVTPEATKAVIERETPALVQAMLFESLRVTPYAMLTRATAGIRRKTLIVNLPGNPKAVTENLEAIAEVLPHAVDIIRGVDTHAHARHGGEAEHGRHDAHSASDGQGERGGHAGHASEAHAGHEHHGERHSAGQVGHEASSAASGQRTASPAGMARNVGGPTC